MEKTSKNNIAKEVIDKAEESKGEDEKHGIAKGKEKVDEGKQEMVGKGNDKSGSINKFATLNSIAEEETEYEDQLGDEMIVGAGKARAAASGVVELMKTLKPKKKGQIDKGRKAKASNASAGQCLSTSI